MTRIVWNNSRPFLIALIVLALLAVGGEWSRAVACPLCADAVDQAGLQAGGGPDGGGSGWTRLGRGFALSIYLMLAMPFVLLGTGAVLVWRGIRRQEASRTIAPSLARIPASSDTVGAES